MPAKEQIPQVFPPLTLINPFSPQLDPQEFLIFQFPDKIPTANTAWLRDELQSLKIPDLYFDHFAASTVTDKGETERAFYIPEHPVALTYAAIRKLPSDLAHDPPFCL